MIANKHTELRLVSNLNDLLEDSRAKREVNKKIHKHTFEYIMTCVSDNDLEDQNIYDIFDDLSKQYQRHCYKIAKEIKEEILNENGEEIETYYDCNDERSYFSDSNKRQVKKEIFLNPKKFTQSFKDNLEEDLTTLVIDSYFKELDNAIKVFEYKNKIALLKEKDVKREYKEDEQYYKDVVRNRIELVYKDYINKGRKANEIITNFECSKEVKDYIFREIMYLVSDYLEDDVDIYVENKVRGLFEKELKEFIKEKKVFLGLNNKQNKQTNLNVKIPKPIKWYAISKVWRDILK